LGKNHEGFLGLPFCVLKWNLSRHNKDGMVTHVMWNGGWAIFSK
jgi:hypothetical protein